MIVDIILWLWVFLLIAFYIFIYYMEKKLHILEVKTLQAFKIKNNLMPWIYELSKKHIIKHNHVFNEIMKLRKVDFSENLSTNDFYKIIHNQQIIHNEINFIFKLCTKHKKLIQNGNFLYLRDIIVEKSAEIGEYIFVYKRMCKIFNKLIKIKNLTIIGLFIPITYKIEI